MTGLVVYLQKSSFIITSVEGVKQMRLEVFVADWSLWFNTGVFYVQMQSCLMQKNILKETNIVYRDICDFCLFILKQCMLVWLDGVILF